MNARTLIVGTLAVVCGLSAMVLVQALRRPVTGPVIEMIPVVFMVTEVKPGDSIQEAMIETREIPKKDVPEDAILKAVDAVDRAANTQLDKGDMLREKKLGEKGSRGINALIRPGMRAFTITTPSFSSSLAGFLLPGNRVDVLLTATTPGGSEDELGGTIVLTLLENVEILAVHNNLNAPATSKFDPEQTRSVTVQVSPEDVKKLDLGQNKGTLHLSLRHVNDNGLVATKGMSLADIQTQLGKKAKPPAPPVVAEVKVEPPKPEPTPMELFPEPQTEEVTLTVRTLRGTGTGQDLLTTVRPVRQKGLGRPTSPGSPTSPASNPAARTASVSSPSGSPKLAGADRHP